VQLITTKAQLLKCLEGRRDYNPKSKIAVEALIFMPDGRLLLEKRGPACKDEIGKLEGVGGSIKAFDDLLEALRSEIRQELGADRAGFKVSIDRLLEVRCVQFDEVAVDRETKRVVGKRPQDWVVVSYLCRALEGTPLIGEADKIEALVYLTLDELFSMPEEKLSRSTVAARNVYRPKYGNRPYYETAEVNA
jgi:hypothetical protein